MTTLKEIAQYLISIDIPFTYKTGSHISLNNGEVWISYHLITGDISIINGFNEQISWGELLVWVLNVAV